MSGPSGRRVERTGRGQATVELALGLPVLVLVALAIVQVGLVVGRRVTLAEAARAGARRGMTDPDDAAVERAALAGLDPARTTVEVRREAGSAGGRLVAVRVRQRVATDVPLVGPLVPDVELEVEAVLPQEPPGAP